MERVKKRILKQKSQSGPRFFKDKRKRVIDRRMTTLDEATRQVRLRKQRERDAMKKRTSGQKKSMKNPKRRPKTKKITVKK